MPRSAEISDARANRKSPVRMATVFPHVAFTDVWPRRLTASSMTSSWYSVARWTISMATAPWISRGSVGSPK